MELKKSLLEAVEERAVGVTIPMLKPGDLIVKPVAVAHPSMVQAELDEIRWRDRFKKQCEKIADEHKDVLDYEDEARTEGNAPVIADKPVYIKDQKLTEDSHAKVAKPEGDKVKAFNNALKYAKKSGEPYCYGYTNSRLGDKFFAFDQPFKWDGDDKAFRAQYKNTGVIYIAYPDKNFIEESLVKAPSLGLDEITPFFEMCKRLGIETFGDLQDFMRECGADKDPLTALKDYFREELHNLDFKVKEEPLIESVDIARCRDILNNEVDWDEVDSIGDVDLAIEQLRSMHTEGAISQEEYDYIIANWDDLLEDKTLTESVQESDSPEDGEEDQFSPLVKIDLSKFRPWGNAVDTYNQIKAAGKLYDLERIIEKAWPEGIEDTTLNDLLAEDRDFISQTIDLEFKNGVSQEGEDK